MDYIEHNVELLSSKQCVLIDPNKGDLIYCMDEDGATFRYTANQRKDLKTKKYKKITENLKNNFKIEGQSIYEIENGLVEISYKTTHFELFKKENRDLK